MRSAPAMIVCECGKRQISVPIAPARISSVSAGTTRVRISAWLTSPSSSTASAPIASTAIGESAAQSLCGPLMWAVARIRAFMSEPSCDEWKR
jgi:uncharacterized membrane protein YdjX (TVP38/TMEM64 family)